VIAIGQLDDLLGIDVESADAFADAYYLEIDDGVEAYRSGGFGTDSPSEHGDR
jgi:hypothetical protein